MATLEKIRSKSALLIIVIGVALFAFIIGDFLNSGSTFFGNRSTIATVDGEKIDYFDFQRQYETVSQQYQQQGVKQDAALIQQQVLGQMIQQTLLDSEIEKLGLVVTGAELSNAMIGENALPQMTQVAQQMGVTTPAELHDMIFNPAKYNIPADQAAQMQQWWLGMEQDLEKQMLAQKFNFLFSGAITANQLDAKAIYDEEAATSTIVFAKKDFSALEDDKYPVSQSEVKDAWNKEKGAYKIDEETRLVNYITVNITPSADDNMAAQKAVEEAVANLKASEGTEGVNNDINFNVTRVNQPEYRIANNQLKNFAKTAEANSVEIISYANDEYTIAKMFGTTSEVDSVQFEAVAFQGSAAQIDSMVNVLNAGKALAEVEGTAGVQGTQPTTWMTLVGVNTPIKEKLVEAETGRFFVGDSLNGNAVIYRVVKRNAPVKVYDVASISYKVEPSNTTINYANTQLREFIAANNTDTAFTASKAMAAGYQLLNAEITKSTAAIGSVKESRDAVKWVMNADKGQVSDIFSDEQGLRLLAVAVTDIYEDYRPARDAAIYNALSQKVRNEKKAADLLAQYNGKATDLAGYAALMEANVDTAQVTFSQPFIAGLGINEGAITGQAPVAALNTLAGPIKTNNAVVVYQVINRNDESRPYSYEESAAKFNSTYGASVLGYRIFQILGENKKIENNILDFFNN